MYSKYALLFLIALLPTSILPLYGQDPVNQPEKFIFYNVVKVDSASAGFLYHNALLWAKENSVKIITADSVRGIIQAENEFFVYKENGMLKKVSGKVSHSLMIEVRDNRYRYHFNEFVFHYYAPDRYHTIIPTGKKKRLEDPEASGWQKLWNSHRAKTLERAQRDIAVLKIKIIEKPIVQSATPEPKKEVKWD
jgi:hypothetical protein